MPPSSGSSQPRDQIHVSQPWYKDVSPGRNTWIKWEGENPGPLAIFSANKAWIAMQTFSHTSHCSPLHTFTCWLEHSLFTLAGSSPDLSWINVNKTQNRIGAWTRGRLVSDLDVFGISLQFNLRSCGIKFWIILCSNILMSFSGDSVVKNPPANAGDASLIPDWGRPPGKRNGSPVQYSCLENPMDRGAW